MYLVAIAWMYVVMMMAVVEALSPNGTVLGALFTFALYGLLPLGIVMYLMGTPMRRQARLAKEQAEAVQAQVSIDPATALPLEPDAGGHAAGAAVAAERKEP